MRARLIPALTFCLCLFSLTTQAQHLTFTPISQSLICWTETECIAVQGNYAYLSDEYVGLHVMDVTDPQQPIETGWYHSPNLIYDIAVSGNYAYLATSGGYLRIVDVSDPNQPVEVAYVHLNHQVVWSVTIRENIVYVGGNYHIYLLDVTNPAAPALLSTAPATYYVQALKLSGNYLYAACSGTGLRVYDISNPLTPALVSICHTPGYAYDLAIQGDRLIVANDTQGLSVLDLTNPAAPVILGTLDTPGNAISVDLLGNYAYLACNHYGVFVIDVSNPAAMTQVGFYSAPGSTPYIKDLDLSGGYAYLAVAYEGFRVLSTADPTNPFEVGGYSNYGYLHAGVKNGDYLYLLDYNSGLRIIEVSDPAVPVQVSGLSLNSEPGYATMVGGYLYVTLVYPFAGIAVVDIDDPANPILITTLPISTSKIVIEGNLAYSIAGDLSIYNVANPLQPILLGSINPSGPMTMDVAVQGGYAYIATDVGLTVVDVSNPSQPRETDYIEFHDKCDFHAVAVSDDIAYMGALNLGMFLVDVSDPQNLSAVSWYQDSWIDDIVFSPDGRYVFSTTYWQGTIGIDVSEPLHPRLAGSYPSLWEAVHVIVENDLLYISSGYYLDICQYSTSAISGDAAVRAIEAVPSTFSVTPNPFNPSTVASFELRVPSHISLRVYDTAGRLVATLVDGWREAGDHEVTFDGANLPSGVYLYRLEASGSGTTPTTAVGKMVLLK